MGSFSVLNRIFLKFIDTNFLALLFRLTSPLTGEYKAFKATGLASTTPVSAPKGRGRSPKRRGRSPKSQ